MTHYDIIDSFEKDKRVLRIFECECMPGVDCRFGHIHGYDLCGGGGVVIFRDADDRTVEEMAVGAGLIAPTKQRYDDDDTKS